ncbi:MAG: hypothetical protein BWY78_00970 [Alphaproteobacteria bacterium ADurb.Bin438]|nr:MAG: hypothetical protein BWY78_00970 [Alphaproteobacteria bacterium ADurb.Bin438]
MSSISLESFSPEVISELKYYVYRLIDPRNGQTFYVGKGKGNRVFAHAKNALSNYKNEDFSRKDEDSEVTKNGTIQAIIDEKLDVINIIHRWGLEEKEAFEVESALIDCYSGLTNLQSGHGSDRGTANAITIENNISRECYEEPDDINYIIIKTSWRAKEERKNLYDATRMSWVLNKNNANKYKYVLSVIDGVVQEVFEVDKNGWSESNNREGRYEFKGKIAQKEVRDLFYNKRIPPEYRKKGSASPVLYKKKNSK